MNRLLWLSKFSRYHWDTTSSRNGGMGGYELNVYSWTCCFYVIKVLSGWCTVHVGECWIIEDHKVQKVGGIIIIFCNNWKFGWLVYVSDVESIRLHEVAMGCLDGAGGGWCCITLQACVCTMFSWSGSVWIVF